MTKLQKKVITVIQYYMYLTNVEIDTALDFKSDIFKYKNGKSIH